MATIKEPEFEAATYTPQDMPRFTFNSMINCEVVAPTHQTGPTRPSTGQCFPIGE